MVSTFVSRVASAFKRSDTDERGYATDADPDAREPSSPSYADEKVRPKEKDTEKESSEDGEVSVVEAGLNPGGLSLEEGTCSSCVVLMSGC